MPRERETNPLDCLFVHTPKFDNWYKPLGDFMWINYLPMGIFALADVLVRRGYSARIIHLGLEWIEDHQFSLLDFLVQARPRVAAFSLHWHHQAYDALKVAEIVKRNFPDTFILLGGFTASYYHREIMDTFSFVDGIIRGEADKPIVRLVQEMVTTDALLHDVPNLTWRGKSSVVENGLSYRASEADLDELCFTNLSLLKNYRTYVDYVGHPFLWKKAFSKEQNFKKLSIRSKTFPLVMGRGCPMSCTWCSGSRKSQGLITGRTRPVYRSTDKILDSIREALEYGYETMYVVFDPFPSRQEFFIDLFAGIRKKKLETEMVFECHGLPSEEFIKAFHKAFPHRESFLCLSPESGSERLRKIHKHHFYSNRDLLDCLETLNRLDVSAEVFFTYGIPGEERGDLKKTVRLKRYIKRHFKNVNCIRILSIEMEPGAPWHLEPEKYGIVNERPRFRDFYFAHSSKYTQTFSSLGYYIPGYFLNKGGIRGSKDFEMIMQKIKCRHFCFLNPDPRKSGPAWTGRLFCNILHLTDKLLSKKSLPGGTTPDSSMGLDYSRIKGTPPEGGPC